MIFDKSRKPGKDIIFIDASREFEQSINQNKLRPQDTEKIVSTYRKRQEVEKYAYPAFFEEIEENEFNLNIPRYVDTFEPEPEIDMAATQMEIKQIETELAETQAKLSAYLKELGF